MWWEYVIIIIFLLISILVLIRHFRKKLTQPGCSANCEGCNLMHPECGPGNDSNADLIGK